MSESSSNTKLDLILRSSQSNNKITKKTDALNKKIIKLQKSLLFFLRQTTREIQSQKILSEKWHIRSRFKWIEKGENLQNIFFNGSKLTHQAARTPIQKTSI